MCGIFLSFITFTFFLSFTFLLRSLLFLSRVCSVRTSLVVSLANTKKKKKKKKKMFVDVNNTLYCSIGGTNQVVTKSLDDPTNTLSIVAGTGCYGSDSDMLAYPAGIFVDLNSNLYVADRNNHRIQYFAYGNRNATTVAGTGAPGTITLNIPIDIVVDGNGYLFIVDYEDHRIVASGPNGFRCVVGCISGPGTPSNQLWRPQSMSFDGDGNMWVADTGNGRIQKFSLKTKSPSTFDLLFSKIERKIRHTFSRLAMDHER